jgi:hypothetical protein
VKRFLKYHQPDIAVLDIISALFLSTARMTTPNSRRRAKTVRGRQKSIRWSRCGVSDPRYDARSTFDGALMSDRPHSCALRSIFVEWASMDGRGAL